MAVIATHGGVFWVTLSLATRTSSPAWRPHCKLSVDRCCRKTSHRPSCNRPSCRNTINGEGARGCDLSTMQESNMRRPDTNTFQPDVVLFLDVSSSLPSTFSVRLEAWDAELEDTSLALGSDYIQWYAASLQGFSASSSLTVDTRQGMILFVCNDCC